MFLILDQPIQQSGGMMTLTDAFVRVNRARGLELVTPDDVLSAAQSLKDTHIPMRLHQFQLGVFVLMTSNYSDEEIRQDMMNQVKVHIDIFPSGRINNRVNLEIKVWSELNVCF